MYRKPHTRFQLVPKLVTSNDHEPRGDRYLAYFTEFGGFGTNLARMDELRPIVSAILV